MSSRPKRAPPRERAAPKANGAADHIELGPLPGYIGYALRRAQVAVFQDFIRALAELDIRPGQFSVLLLLEANPGLKPSQVSAALGIQRTNFVALFAELERRGLTRRAPAADDRRSHVLHLTERGAEFLQRMKALQQVHEKRVTGLIGAAGRRQLLGLLAKLSAAGDA